MNLKSIFRDDDGELLGFIEQIPDTTQWQAYTIFKYPLQVAQNQQQAKAILHEKGLSILMEKWYFFDATRQDWFACHIVEASAEKIRYKIIDFNHPDQYRERLLTSPNSSNFRPDLQGAV